MAGAYLFKLLRKDWALIDIYDVRHKTKCGMSLCAWVLKNNSKRIGMNVGLTEAAIYVKRLKNA